MKNKRTLIAVLVLAMAAVTVFLSSGLRSGGKAKSADETAVLASYKHHTVTQGEIDYQKSISTSALSAAEKTDKAIIDRLLTGFILLEEAEKAGLSATDAEIKEMVEASKTAYELPDGKAMIDEYCAGAGITVEEYFALIEQQAYATISRQKLRNEFDKDYCEKNDIPYGNFSAETYEKITEAYNKYRQALLKAHSGEIVYYD